MNLFEDIRESFITERKKKRIRKCGDKCRKAKGGECRCVCNGKYHGTDRRKPEDNQNEYFQSDYLFEK